MNLKEKYYRFHGKNPPRTRKKEFHVPKNLLILGKAHAIEYECDKLHGGGDGKKAVYRHVFETPAYVCMDEREGKQLYIIGGRIKVTEAGIEN